MKRLLYSCLLCCNIVAASSQSWPTPLPEAKAGTRWWWMGSAVDKDNLQWNLSEYARAGIGAVEITPLYGVQGNEKNELPFLSPQWMLALKDVQDIARPLGIEVDMNCGTGWPFGGPTVSLEEAACKAVFHKIAVGGSLTGDQSVALRTPTYTIDIGRTKQKVKRAAPGGEGLVIDHFDRNAVKHYLDRFDKAFAESGIPYPHTFFNDSYEVYEANWTPTLFDEFQKRRGYDLRQHLPELLGAPAPSVQLPAVSGSPADISTPHPAVSGSPADISTPAVSGSPADQVLADYRETLSDLLYENFTQQWVAWAHSHGVQIRNQAHGSPANLLDLYAAVDIPEIEGFGLSDFGIKGLRTDPGMTKKNFSDVSMLKYASSAAHVMGKPFTSSETFTWLTEHFRTSLSQMKPDLDLMFTCGVNHVFFHGSCYTPKDDPWPGWKFYASVDMSPTNSIWRDAPYMMQYIERCQSFLQLGKPDNDFLVYLPVRDMWRKRLPMKTDKKGNPILGSNLLMQFDIHSMAEKAPEFIRSILTIDSLGYDCDYISDRQLAKVRVENGMLVTEGGTRYKALIIPSGTTIDDRLLATLRPIASQPSPLIIYGEDPADMQRYAQAEPMRTQLGLRAIRRQTASSTAPAVSGSPTAISAPHPAVSGSPAANSWHYFIANLTPADVDADVALAVPFQSATWYDPMTGDITPAAVHDGQVRIALRSGESRILQTSAQPAPSVATGLQVVPSVATGLQVVPSVATKSQPTKKLPLTGPWTLTFTDEAPRVGKRFQLATLQTWETLSPEAAVTMGTGVYTTTFRLTNEQARQHWLIDLGDVRESARVYVNDQFIGCAWAVPFILDCKNTLKKGKNTLRIEVTNLPANRIADMDRQGVQWRKMKEINVVDINYKKTTYAHWAPMPSGLNSTVRLIAK